MDEQIPNDPGRTPKPGPALNPSVQEVQGVFPSEAAMETAIAQLALAGFDRAAFSMPQTRPLDSQATPEQGATTPLTDTDVRQARTMGTSMAGTIGAFAAAGAVVATGGAAAVAAVAAVAVGAGSALAAEAVGGAADKAQAESRAEAAAAGTLVLSVAAPDSAHQRLAERLMREAGATKVAAIQRMAGALTGIDSSSWTG
jgi:hypothetical protein